MKNSPENLEILAHNTEIDKQLKELLPFTLRFTNKLSKEAQKEFDNSFNRDRNMLYIVDSIAEGIHGNRNLKEKGQYAWVISGSANFKNKKTGYDFRENLVEAGYDYRFGKDTSFGFAVGKNFGEYDGLNYGLYLNKKYVSIFLNRTHFKKKHHFHETDLGIVVSNSYNYEKYYIEPTFKTIYRKTGSMSYSVPNMKVKIDKDNSLYLEGAFKMGYRGNKCRPYFIYSVGKDFGRKYDVIFNGDLTKKAKGDYTTQAIGLGMDFNVLPATEINVEINKEFSSKYKTKANLKVGMQYTF